MRILVLGLILALIGGFLAWRTGVLDAQTPGQKLAAVSSGRVAQQAAAAAGVPSPETGYRAPVVSPTQNKEEKVPKDLLFYKFQHRPVPPSLGTIDLAGNSVTKEVEHNESDSTVALWRSLDVPIVHRKVRLTVLEFSSPRSSGFSLPTLLSSLAQTLTSSKVSVQSGDTGVTVSTINPITIGAQYLPAIAGILNQAHDDVLVRSRLSVTLWFNNGSSQSFTDFEEQSSNQVTSTQVAVTTTSNVRQAGFSLNLTPTITDEFTMFSYKMSNTSPTSDATQAGTTLEGVGYVGVKPLVLLDSVREGDTRTLTKFVGIPVGWLKSRVDREDMVIIEFADSALKDVPFLHSKTNGNNTTKPNQRDTNYHANNYHN